MQRLAGLAKQVGNGRFDLVEVIFLRGDVVAVKFGQVLCSLEPPVP